MSQPLRFGRGIERLAKSETGIAAVEFAILLPFMLLIYMGVTEIVQAMMASRKASVIARSLSDLVAQQPANSDLTAAQLNDIMAGARALIAPFANGPLKMTVSSIEFSAKPPPATGYDAKTRWSVTNNSGRLRPCGAMTAAPAGTSGGNATVPADLYGPGSVIVADVDYTYTPAFGGGVLAWTTSSSSVKMSRTMYMRPRIQNAIAYVGGNGVVCF